MEEEEEARGKRQPDTYVLLPAPGKNPTKTMMIGMWGEYEDIQTVVGLSKGSLENL